MIYKITITPINRWSNGTSFNVEWFEDSGTTIRQYILWTLQSKAPADLFTVEGVHIFIPYEVLSQCYIEIEKESNV